VRARPLDIFAECARIARGGVQGGALASVARRHGSLPMSATAKMLVTLDGRRLGTVGGGCLEAEIIERALAVAAARAPAVSEHTLNSELAGDYGLTCGGTAVMFIEPVYEHPVLASVYDACVGVLARGDRGVMATASDWSGGPQKVLAVNGARHGAASDDLAAAVVETERARVEQRFEGAVFAERSAGAPPLVIFGAGHVGIRVAEAAAFAGWRVTLVDDRPEFADPARIPVAERVVAAPFHAVPEDLPLGDDAYAVVATRGHQHDAVVVEQLARRDLAYLGMLGSRRKVALTWGLLERAGVPRERLERIHAPVGLAIGADTPEEIAVSVVAEMIAVRRAGSKRRGGIDVR
jgi:xanthine dehydrogenase accessory factor